MNIKDLFKFFIKTFGLYSLITGIFTFVPFITNNLLPNFYPLGFILTIIGLAILIGLFLILIFKTDQIIKGLKLDQGFNHSKINLNQFSELRLLKIAIIIISGITFITYFPGFIFESITYFTARNTSESGLLGLFSKLGPQYVFDLYNWIVCLVNITISYLIFSNYKHISTFIYKKIVEKEEFEEE